MFEASVVISTYNRLNILKLALEGFKRQTADNFEVIIADDGSNDETRDFLEKNKDSYPFPLKHVWQEDKGFRKSRIFNKAIVSAESDYIISNDDLIPHKEFVKTHISMREKGYFVVGRSVLLSEKLSRIIDESYVSRGKLEGINLKIILDTIFGDTKFGEFSIYIKNDLLMNLLLKRRIRKSWDKELGGWNRALYGGNFSAWKDDLIKVNGFDEEFVGWGYEDNELHFRLLRIGLKPKPSMNRAINYHYYHDRSHAVISEINKQRYKTTRETDIIRCKKGIDQHLQGEL